MEHPMHTGKQELEEQQVEAAKQNFVYILRCADGTLYTGWSNCLANREQMHNAGKGAKYTASRLPVTLVYWEAFASKREAMQREYQIKRFSRAKKLMLMEGAAR